MNEKNERSELINSLFLELFYSSTCHEFMIIHFHSSTHLFDVWMYTGCIRLLSIHYVLSLASLQQNGMWLAESAKLIVSSLHPSSGFYFYFFRARKIATHFARTSVVKSMNFMHISFSFAFVFFSWCFFGRFKYLNLLIYFVEMFVEQQTEWEDRFFEMLLDENFHGTYVV